MADDIVTRLRRQSKTGSIFFNAADEIERLRKRIADLERELAGAEVDTDARRVCGVCGGGSVGACQCQ